MPQQSGPSASKLIGEFNKKGLFEAPIQWNAVEEALSDLSAGHIRKILDELEEKKDSVRDATGWVKVAAKNKKQFGQSAASKGGAWNMASMWMPMMMGMGGMGVQKPMFGKGKGAGKA